MLDDYHVIDAPSIHQALAFLLDHLPAHLHLIIATRADPPLPLSRLRARGELTELRATDLRFTADEAAAFLTEVMQLPLSADAVAALEVRTEGWIAGLQFAALAMRDRTDHASFIAAFTGSNRFVMDYLLEEVFERLPGHLQSFLNQTSILERLCGPLCDALLLGALPLPQPGLHHAQAGASQALLEELERTNLFLVALDDDRHWYRYHHLFAEMVHTRLLSAASSETIATLHRCASAWYEQQGLIAEAVRHALRAQDVERAAHVIEQGGLALALQGQISTVHLHSAWLVRRAARAGHSCASQSLYSPCHHPGKHQSDRDC
jgi:LuxR family maltose regulon positive regulatory protein